jgi:anaphase-promoting complex subunit 2
MATKLAAQKQAIFRSVFQTEISQPTPHATPSLRFPEQGQPFGGPGAVAHALFSGSSSGGGGGNSPRRQSTTATTTAAAGSSLQGHVDDQVRWDRAWHAVTSRIQLPPSVAAEDSFGPLPAAVRPSPSLEAEAEFYDALRVVLYPEKRAPRARHTEDVLAWHTQQVRHHFIQHVLPLLAACDGGGGEKPPVVLLASIRTLEAAHRQYLYGLQTVLRGLDGKKEGEKAVGRFRRDLHAMVGNAMTPGLMDALRIVSEHQTRTALGIPREGGERPAKEVVAAARSELVSMVESLAKVGLAGERFQMLFAEVMDAMMGEFVVGSYAGRWSFGKGRRASSSGWSYCTAHLQSWVEDHFSRLAVEVLNQLGGPPVAWSDVSKWKEIAIARLATLRINELFDIVLQWPDSRDGLEDLRVSVTTPQRRLQLTDMFSQTLQRRLLHPGCSTLKILQVYISMIRTFHALDHSKVLLDRVVDSLQLYLCQRDDAIRIVVAGLLHDPSKDGSGTASDTLTELAGLLNSGKQPQESTVDDDLDWDDMTWVPVPVDASVNYKRPKSEDVIGTLIGALGSKDTFIKEFQSILADRLLWGSAKGPGAFRQELAVLKLLRKRFGENALQNCEVMHMDVLQSDSLHPRVRDDLGYLLDGRKTWMPGNTLPDIRLRILSRLFWPTLPREHFIIPPPVQEVQRRYEDEFRKFKADRKLTFINNLGAATVELELEDRKITQKCKTYQAAVIYAFAEDASDELRASGPAKYTLDELEEKLQMDTDLLEESLAFWVEKRVLKEFPAGAFAVLESLSDEKGDGGDAGVAPAAAAAPAASVETPSKKPPKRAMNAAEKEQRRVYWQFIKGMLTNSAASMPLAQIAMMMKMLIPGGFPWSNEELQVFLGDLVGEGELELAGGKFKLVKK